MYEREREEKQCEFLPSSPLLGRSPSPLASHSSSPSYTQPPPHLLQCVSMGHDLQECRGEHWGHAGAERYGLALQQAAEQQSRGGGGALHERGGRGRGVRERRGV
jgi:hypothetical protein